MQNRIINNHKKISILIPLAVSAIMIFPVGIFGLNADNMDYSNLQFYGTATITQYDPLGNPVFTQTIHNQLLDSGEQFILQNTFKGSGNDTRIASICITNEDPVTVSEGRTVTDFDSANTIGQNNCKTDDAVDLTTLGVAKIQSPTFRVGNQAGDLSVATTITGIGICQNSTNITFTDCGTAGQTLFAVIDVADITLNPDDSVDISYEFNIASPDT